jgi:hypothetical protein
MAKKGGFFQTLGNLWRWTVWGLAAVLVAALWLGWSNRQADTEGDVVAGAEAPAEAAATDVTAAAEETPVEAPAEEVAAAAEEPAAGTVPEEVEAAVEEVTEAAQEAVTAVGEAAENTVAEVQSAVEGALGAAGEVAQEAEGAASALADQAETAVNQALEGGSAAEVPATQLDEVAAAEAPVSEEEADLNIVPPELSNITIPGDPASYALISVFQSDDGTIEVVSDRTENGATVQTIRLVTCAPLAVGVIAEGDAPRNEAPELERIPLGSAAATIAALACGAMN